MYVVHQAASNQTSNYLSAHSLEEVAKREIRACVYRDEGDGLGPVIFNCMSSYLIII